MDFKNKYLKYKAKYLRALQHQNGGTGEVKIGFFFLLTNSDATQQYPNMSISNILDIFFESIPKDKYEIFYYVNNSSGYDQNISTVITRKGIRIKLEPFEESKYAEFSMVSVPIKCVNQISAKYRDITHIMFVSESCLPTVSGQFFISTIQNIVPNNSWTSYPNTMDDRCAQYKKLLERKMNEKTVRQFCEYHNIYTDIRNVMQHLMDYQPIISRQQSLWYSKHMKYFLDYYDLFEYLHNNETIRGSDEVFVGNFINVINIILTGSKHDFYWTIWSISDADFFNYNYQCDAHRSSPYIYDFKDNINVLDIVKILTSKSLFVRKVKDAGNPELIKQIMQHKENMYAEIEETDDFRKLQGILYMIQYLDISNKLTNIYSPKVIQEMLFTMFSHMRMKYDNVKPFLVHKNIGHLEYCYSRIKYFEYNELTNEFATTYTDYDERCNVLKTIISFLPGDDIEKLVTHYLTCNIEATQIGDILGINYKMGYASVDNEEKEIPIRCHDNLVSLIELFQEPKLRCLLAYLLGFRVGYDDAKYAKAQKNKRKSGPSTESPAEKVAKY